MGIHQGRRARAAAGWRRLPALAALGLALALALGAAAPALAMDAPQTRWSRLWGQGALDTMHVFVQALIPRMCMRIFRLSSRMFFDFVHWRAGAPTFPTFRA